MHKPVAVLISDVHYNLQTLQVADTAMRMAIDKANSLNIALIVAGDLHDTKANMRGECVNAMRETFLLCETDCYVLIGNHDRLNEKDSKHSLNFLDSIVRLVISPTYSKAGWLFPYYHDAEMLRSDISGIYSLRGQKLPLILHQGVTGSKSGEYIQDKSAINPEDVAGMRVISGHYHTRQDFALPNGGKWSYVGNPFTLNYAEANDPPKGFQILYNDGSLEFVPTNLRKHVVIEASCSDLTNAYKYNKLNLSQDDLVWLKLSGTREELQRYTKDKIKGLMPLTENFRLDLIPIDTVTTEQPILSNHELMDSLIDSLTNTSEGRKVRLKELWKNL